MKTKMLKTKKDVKDLMDEIREGEISLTTGHGERVSYNDGWEYDNNCYGNSYMSTPWPKDEEDIVAILWRNRRYINAMLKNQI